MNDHVKNQVQANTLSHEFNTNNPKESKTLIAIDTRDKNIKKLDHKKLVLDSSALSISDDKLKKFTKLKLNSILNPIETEYNNEENIFKADLLEGQIGGINGHIDFPQDNIFRVNINQEVNENYEYFMKYDVYGVNGIESVARSINTGNSKGGYFISKSKAWNLIVEKLQSRLLNTGMNIIRFGSVDSSCSYKIRNLSIYKRPINSESIFELSNAHVAYSNEHNLIYLRSILSDSITKVFLNGIELEIENGELEFVHTLTEEEITSRKLMLILESKAQLSKVFEIGVKDDKTYDLIVPIRRTQTSVSKSVSGDQMVELKIDGASLYLDSGSIKSKLDLTIRPLRSVDVIPMNAGLLNVTKSGIAYRFLPHNTVFEKIF
ncbi:MAG: hypothetical protein IPI30_13800 [Saprospiraceae bacterium]|nr:hypothetical protein [Candidatus Vicinibacter affinis]